MRRLFGERKLSECREAWGELEGHFVVRKRKGGIEIQPAAHFS